MTSLTQDYDKVCCECASLFDARRSEMSELCPECAHLIYGYANCSHEFSGQRCVLCRWDGSRSEYTENLASKP